MAVGRTRWLIAIGSVEHIEIRISEVTVEQPKIRLETKYDREWYDLSPDEAWELQQALKEAQENLTARSKGAGT